MTALVVEHLDTLETGDTLPSLLLSDPDRKVMRGWGAYRDKLMYGRKTSPAAAGQGVPRWQTIRA